MRSPRTAMRSGPCLAHLEKALAARDPAQPKNKDRIKKKKKKTHTVHSAERKAPKAY